MSLHKILEEDLTLEMILESYKKQSPQKLLSGLCAKKFIIKIKVLDQV